MQTVPRPDASPSILRFASVAALIALVIPLLPMYGADGTAFVFSLGFPVRALIEYFLGYWSDAIVVAAGIVFLRRGHVGVAGGIFGAVALGLAITIVAQILATAPHFERWQTVVLLMLEIVQTILLVVAAARAIGTFTPTEREA
jgi:hypothetical protein